MGVVIGGERSSSFGAWTSRLPPFASRVILVTFVRFALLAECIRSDKLLSAHASSEATDPAWRAPTWQAALSIGISSWTPMLRFAKSFALALTLIL